MTMNQQLNSLKEFQLVRLTGDIHPWGVRRHAVHRRGSLGQVGQRQRPSKDSVESVSALTQMIRLPITIEIRAGALNDLSSILASQGLSTSGNIGVVVSPGSGKAIAQRLAPVLPNARWHTVTDCTLDSAVQLAEQMRSGRYDVVVGIGGGKIVDTAKYAAAQIGLPLVAVPTNLAHDGICSPVSILDSDAGRSSYSVPIPIIVIVDLDVIRQSPSRFVAAGIGDTVSNISAIADWDLSHQETKEPLNRLSITMAHTAAQSLLHHPGTLQDDGLLTILAESLVVSGIAMNIAGSSRPCSGGCHEISHALDILFPGRNALHGEQVGIGAAFATYLRGDSEMAGRIAECLSRHSLPITAAEIGFSDEEFAQAVLFAPQTRPGRYTILEHLDLSLDTIRDAYADYVKAASSVNKNHVELVKI
ncbi:iron-containing alcohol dehydrogenase family protein [Nostoc sp. NMS4]|uniref:iron-containing alcohol dehydrogenase family protein n=1 Tax=Nostoc sp. NMS4 TaxID=2815390 RepID=UPI0025FF2413|nr:iron-containing alcohol dehydrogenase family protein [Nostoc sp. NMS4]